MKQPIVFVILLTVMLSSAGPAAIINITEEYTTIQAGINASNIGYTIPTQSGMYVETR